MDVDLEHKLDCLRKEEVGFPKTEAYKDGSLCMHDILEDSTRNTTLEGLYWIRKEQVSEGILESLMLKPEANEMVGKSVKPYPVYYKHPSNPAYIGLPKFFGLSAFGKPKIDTRSEGLSIDVKWNSSKTLRPEQAWGLQETYKTLARWGGAFFIADCGFGKSVCIAALIHKLQKKTMLVVPTLTLVHQLYSELHDEEAYPSEVKLKKKRRVTTLEAEASNEQAMQTKKRDLLLLNANAGILQGSWEKTQANVEGKDIVIASLDSLAQFRYPDAFYKEFGLVIFDEAHHMAAQTLSQILPWISSKNVVGFSATPDRRDGLEHSLFWLLGPVSFVYRRLPTITGKKGTVLVKKLCWKTSVLGKANYMGTVNFADMQNQIAANVDRNTKILQLVQSLKETRYKILLLTAFREHAETLYSDVREAMPECKVQLIHGAMRKEQRAVQPNVKVLVATYGLLEEGFDDADLDTLIMCTARSRVQQTVGRIERTKQGKLTPIVYDIVDQIDGFGASVYNSMWFTRRKFYKSRGFTLEEPKGEATEKEKPEFHDDAFVLVE